MDWPGLLAWSTKYHDGTEPSKFNVMSDEDKKFLEKAMEQAMSTIEDFNQTLKDGLAKLSQGLENKDQALMIVALEIIDRCIDDPDCCRNLEVFGGLAPMFACLGKEEKSGDVVEESEVARRACEILSLMLSNNDALQKASVFKHGALDRLLDSSNGFSKDRFSVLSAAVRGQPECTELFLSQKNGMSFLFSILRENTTEASYQSKSGKILARKAALFIRHLVGEDESRVVCDEATMTGNQATLGQAISRVNESQRNNSVDLDFAETVADIAGIYALAASNGMPGVATELYKPAQERLKWLEKDREASRESPEVAVLRQVVGRS